MIKWHHCCWSCRKGKSCVESFLACLTGSLETWVLFWWKLVEIYSWNPCVGIQYFHELLSIPSRMYFCLLHVSDSWCSCTPEHLCDSWSPEPLSWREGWLQCGHWYCQNSSSVNFFLFPSLLHLPLLLALFFFSLRGKFRIEWVKVKLNLVHKLVSEMSQL